MTSRTIVLAGATSGPVRRAAVRLSDAGHRLILIGRDPARAASLAARTMPVTDLQVDRLRAQLTDDPETHRRLLARLDQDADKMGYTFLVSAGFFHAVDRRFAGKATVADVIEFIADVRASSSQVAQDIHPSTAERIVLDSLGEDVPIADIDAKTRFGVQIVLLGALIAYEQHDEAGLDQVLAEARRTADEWLQKVG